jgi:hypothetical protein
LSYAKKREKRQETADMADIRVDGLRKPIAVVEYLYRRLHEMGIRSVHGVPGDYNLVALDYLPKAKLNWVGSVNELNAGQLHPTTFLVVSVL